MREGIGAQPLARLQWVHRDTLRANDYNPNHVPPLEFELLALSIRETGWTQPIVVQADGQTIVDGFHRWTASGRPEIFAMTGGVVPIVVCDALSPGQQKAATVRHNRARGVHGIRPMIAIVQDLVASGEWTAEDVQRELGMESEEVERLLDLRPNPERLGNAGNFGKAWTPEG